MTERYVVLDFDPVVEGADLPEGTYKIQVLEANIETAQSGNKMIVPQMEVIDDPQHNGRRIFDRIVLLQSTAWKYNQICRALGITPSKNVNLDDWAGRTCWVEGVLDETGRFSVKRYRKGA